MLFSVHVLSKSIPRIPTKILKVEISLSVLKLMYLSEYITDSSKLGLRSKFIGIKRKFDN